MLRGAHGDARGHWDKRGRAVATGHSTSRETRGRPGDNVIPMRLHTPVVPPPRPSEKARPFRTPPYPMATLSSRPP